jgi:hypothetical protein
MEKSSRFEMRALAHSDPMIAMPRLRDRLQGDPDVSIAINRAVRIVSAGHNARARATEKWIARGATFALLAEGCVDKYAGAWMTRSRRGWTRLFSWSIAAVTIGCSHSSASHTTEDAGTSDATACGDEDGCGQSDAETDVLVVDTGWVCPVIPESNAGTTCDTCIQTHCDAHWCACEADKNIDEAGTPECLAYLTCLETCPVDAGDAEACPTAGCAPSAFGQTSQQNGQALFACIAQSCASACPGVISLSL